VMSLGVELDYFFPRFTDSSSGVAGAEGGALVAVAPPPYKDWTATKIIVGSVGHTAELFMRSALWPRI